MEAFFATMIPSHCYFQKQGKHFIFIETLWVMILKNLSHFSQLVLPQGRSGDRGGKIDCMGILLINTAAIGADNRKIIFKLLN